jgi:hypothetical protein
MIHSAIAVTAPGSTRRSSPLRVRALQLVEFVDAEEQLFGHMQLQDDDGQAEQFV